jgi:hypothetical protein
MIQRIQTVYLLLAALLTGHLFSGPIATYLLADKSLYEMWLTGIKESANTPMLSAWQLWPLWFLGVVIAILSLISILLYKNRMLQMRLAIFASILLVGLEGLMVFYIHHYSVIVNAVEQAYTYRLILPLVAIILLILAIRAIRKDDLLASAYQRLR